MRIRSKVWLLVCVSVTLTAVGAFVMRIVAMRQGLLEQARTSAEELASDITQALERVEADAADAELALVLTSYLGRHPRIQHLQLTIAREAASESVRIALPRGEQWRIERGFREPVLGYGRVPSGEGSVEIRKVVDLRGPWKGTLLVRVDLQPVVKLIRDTERWSLAAAVVQLVALLLLTGAIADRVVVRRLKSLTAAMSDVERGDLDRRVPIDGRDEVALLSHGFNRMLERLSEADREIRAFSQRLADEVEAATQDLSKKNLALAQLNRLLHDLRRENASKVRLAALGQLAAQLAHEIGTPLSSVSGHLQLALLQRQLPAGLRERLEVASREIARIGRIVRDYLDSTRTLEPEQKPTSLRRVLEEAVEVTRSVDPARPLEVSLGEEPEDFITDPGLLRQIVINLLTNAFDAVERGGRVSLAARAHDQDVLITVGDTGAGIPPDDLRRIFEPFYTTKGRGKGTGLGLAICRELAAALGGSIAVESAPGAGSTFTVRLPRHGRPEGASGEIRTRPAAQGAA